MFYKGIIFDLDNTLYNYETCHMHALKNIFEYLGCTFNCHITDLENMYEKITHDLKKELINTASCHNKSIYLKHLLEKFKSGLSEFSTIHNLYWKSFYDKIECYPGVKEFILWNVQKKIKIGILTDYETEHQIIKLEKLGLLEYVDVIVTSEEVGKEKPSKQMLYAVLAKLQLSTSDVIVIGDNFEKDIRGSHDLNILAYWFSPSNIKPHPSSFHCFYNLLRDFTSIYDDLTQLTNISKFCGERFDLVQAGGGNTSVKTLYDWLIIKASGHHLASLDMKNGYVIVDNKKIVQDIHTNSTTDVTGYNVINGSKRASIETFLHTLLKKYTVHLHPIQLNRILICKNARSIINKIYPNSVIIDYLTPGIKICNKIKQEYTNQNVIFLLNHGVIISSDEICHVYNLIDGVLEKFESFQNLNMKHYKFTNIISKTVNSVFDVDHVSYLCEDKIINKYLCEKYPLFLENVTFPDSLIYCGAKCLSGLINVQKYKDLYEECPKIIIENNFVYITAITLMKCKEIEDVLKSQLFILDNDFDKNYLSPDEICFLNNWDSEKFRKTLNTL